MGKSRLSVFFVRSTYDSLGASSHPISSHFSGIMSEELSIPIRNLAGFLIHKFGIAWYKSVWNLDLTEYFLWLVFRRQFRNVAERIFQPRSIKISRRHSTYFFVGLFLDKKWTEITNSVPDLQVSYVNLFFCVCFFFAKMSTNVFFLHRLSLYTLLYS